MRAAAHGLALVLAAALAAAAPACAATLLVGDGGLPTLAAAVRQAHDGDTIQIGPGDHYECAVLPQRNLTIEGVSGEGVSGEGVSGEGISGEGVTTTGQQSASVLTDHACQGKALLVVQGDGLTVRNLVLARVRVPDHNGAGIRLEAQGLTLDHVRFENDEVGVLAGPGGAGEIRVRDCVFHGGGVSGPHPTAALMVPGVALLQVERSRFDGVKGAQIRTAAALTVLTGNHIGTGVAPGAGAAVEADAGRLVMRDNVLAVGPHAPPRDAAVVALGTGADLQGNTLQNTTGHPQRLLLDWMTASPSLSGNVVAAADTRVSSAGLWRHRAGTAAHTVLNDAHTAAGLAKRAVHRLFGP